MNARAVAFPQSFSSVSLADTSDARQVFHKEMRCFSVANDALVISPLSPSPLRAMQWSGNSPLPQIVSGTPHLGHLLVISLFTGIGSLLVSLLALGVRCSVVVVESDDLCRHISHSCFRFLSQLPEVEDITEEFLDSVFSAGNFSAVLVAGNYVPDPFIDSLNLKKEGVSRIQAILSVTCLVRHMLPSKMGRIPVYSLFESVPGLPIVLQEAAAEAFAGPPIEVNVGSFGWVSGVRAFWGELHGFSMSSSTQAKLPKKFTLIRGDRGPLIQWSGPKPWPEEIFFHGGYRPSFDAAPVAEDDGGFSTLVCGLAPFAHESEKFPSVGHGRVLRKGSFQRLPNARERALMYGSPECLLHAVPDTCASRDEVQCSLLAKASHVPSVIAALFMLLQDPVQSQAVPRAAYVGLELRLRSAAQGTVFQPGIVQSFPGVLCARDLCQQVSANFALEGFQLPALAPMTGDDDRAISALQVYWVDAVLRGLPSEAQGPQYASQRQKYSASAALGLQRGGPLSREATPPLLAKGLGKDLHMLLSSTLPSPFDADSILDDDVIFAIRAMCILGPCIRAWRRRQVRAMKRLAHLMQPWDSYLKKCMPESVRKIAGHKSPATMAAFGVLMRWPDSTMPSRFAQGFKLIGHIEHTGLFRQLETDISRPAGALVLLGEHAKAFKATIFARVHKGEHAQALVDFTQQ